MKSPIKSPIPPRRRFLVLAAVATAALPLAALRLFGNARAADLPMLPVDNAQAKALAYTDDATKARHPSFKPGSDCANCRFFTTSTGACSLFAGFRVVPTGWCLAWSKQAG